MKFANGKEIVITPSSRKDNEVLSQILLKKRGHKYLEDHNHPI